MKILHPLLSLLALCQLQMWTQATDVPCSSDDECENILRKGSVCSEEGFCTNPFYQTGCLSHLPEWSKTRICNSDDPPEAVEKGYCRPSPFDYMEIRALSQDWEEAIFSTWVFQILMSEVVGVPVSIEQGQGFANDFYHRESAFDLGTFGGNYPEITTASNTGDCRTLKTDDPNEYIPCAHVCIESWRYPFLVDAEVETPKALGMQGATALFISRRAVEKDPSLISYLGLSGEHNRRKMAETFKRPTTWKQYCDEVSTTNCTIDDGVASRAPMDETENDSMYVEGLYIGHFRYTADNDCDAYPLNCTGHFTAYPCRWRSFSKQQFHHLDIALKSNGKTDSGGGYTYSQLFQIWRAANATENSVIMRWWSPQTLVSEMHGSGGEFMRLVLPPPTQACEDARIDTTKLCGDDEEAKIGAREGSCDYPQQVIKKVVAKSLHSVNFDPAIPAPLWSPAYETIENFRLSNVGMQSISGYWIEGNIDKKYDPREAVCRWVSDNLENLKAFIPETYPRVIEEEDGRGDELYVAALVLACLAVVVVFVIFLVTNSKRHTRTMYHAQLNYLYLLLSGQLLVAMSSCVWTVPPSDASCVFAVWLTDLGYALQLIPLFLRVFLIYALANGGKQMQRVKIRTDVLLKVVLFGTAIVGTFLAVWTIVDVPRSDFQYELTGKNNEQGETVVTASAFCGSDSDVWRFLSLSWQVLLVVPAVVVAFVASSVLEDLNDTKTLGLTVCVHLVFLVLRACVFALGDQEADMMRYVSIMLSCDTIATTLVYFLPKFTSSGDTIESEILPDLFVGTTVVMASIDGFTAWSSVRDPVQVFKYLEIVFEELDVIAARHRVFKVETSGECYVAAAGIPMARTDHAVVMARFASDCLEKMGTLSKKLEVQFGPDTCDLTMRIGMHSGPVTGGFMRARHTRFQLFGDTMTTASLIHRTGESQRVHMSEETATELVNSGRKKWVQEREDGVRTVDKGELQTYWLTRHNRRGGAAAGNAPPHGSNESVHSADVDFDVEIAGLDSEQQWIQFNVKVLRTLLENIVARRLTHVSSIVDVNGIGDSSLMPLEEVKEIIEFPGFDMEATRRQRMNQGQVQISDKVMAQLREQVTQIAAMYAPNPFHNFAHASYVVMAVTKFMSRIIAASEVEVEYDEYHEKSSVQAAIHDHTFGITSDPLTQFACVYSALIKDVDHPGVPNSQVVKEQTHAAKVYDNQSVTEQKSFDMAWDLFIDPAFKDLRSTICNTEEELRRFRQLVINSVMATDLLDPELRDLRHDRWSKAFDNSSTKESSSREATNRKATIVIEHLIQAADVAHTCQHWTIYRKWTRRLFFESYKAYGEGRTETNPADYWYEGELGFFDYYVIPLSEKLRDCGVFGLTSEENLNYAEDNRAMWVQEGESIVEEMIREVA